MGNDNKMIEVCNIHKSFAKDNRELKVLNQVSFNVNRGEIVCILGSSGCGKSTLLRILGGFDRADEGHVAIDGFKVMKPSPEAMLIFQDFNQLLPWKTVLQNVSYPLRINKREATEEERRQRAQKYLELVQLEGFLHSYPHELSGGMKQKAALARALSLEPSILLMDEPFGSLDALTRQNLQGVLLTAWEQTHVTIVFVTHDIQEAILLADRIIVMGKNPGCIQAQIVNELDRPRNIGGSSYMELYSHLYSLLCKEKV